VKLWVIMMLCLTTGIFIAAASTLKLYAGGAPFYTLIVALALYVIGNVLVVPLMRESGLGVTISILSVTQLLLVNVIAFSVYGEKIGRLQLSGILLGIVAIALMLWPTKQGA
jgi:multidrug transporter EmrE-like cation transporter